MVVRPAAIKSTVKSPSSYKSGVKTVFIPVENKDDLIDVASIVKDNLKIIPVTTVKEVLELTGLIKNK